MNISELIDFSGPSSPDALSSEAQKLDKDAFLRLLVTELQNQDPFEPMEETDFIAQLAQFSSLEQAQNTNESLQSLIALQQESQQLTSLAQGAALIGKEVTYYDPDEGTVFTGKVEAVDVMDDGIAFKIGDKYVPFSNILQVNEPGQE